MSAAHPWCKGELDRSDSARVTGNVGLTLPELLVGIVMLLLILSATAPIFADLRQAFDLRGVSQQLYADLQWARMSAVSHNRRYRWTLVDDSTYALSRYDAAADEWETVRTTDVRLNARGVTLAASGQIIFAPNGGAPTYGTVSLSGAAANIGVSVGPSGSVHIE